ETKSELPRQPFRARGRPGHRYRACYHSHAWGRYGVALPHHLRNRREGHHEFPSWCASRRRFFRRVRLRCQHPYSHSRACPPLSAVAYRTIVVADGKKVTEFRSGKSLEVEQVERCG